MTSAVRVLVVSPPAPVWGAQLYLLDQVEALADRGVELTLGSPPSSEFAAQWARRGHPVLDLDVGLHPNLSLSGTAQRPPPRAFASAGIGIGTNFARIARVARRFDMLYSFSLRTHLETALAGKVVRVPTALDLVDLVRPGSGRKVLQAAARLADLTVANSTATAATLDGVGPVRVIHPGIDLQRFHAAPHDAALRDELTGGTDAEALIGIVGRLDERKGVQILVDAMTRLRGDAARARLVVVGDAGTGPPEFAEQLRRDATGTLGDRVNFVGRRTDIADIMRALDVLVVASQSEPFGLTALEAQACGTPVIGTDAGGLPEFVEHEITGLLVPPFEAEPLARAIERVLGDDDLVSTITAEARRRADPHRGLQAQYDEIAQMYRDVATGAVHDG